MQLFGTTGQKFLHCPGTKGQRDKLKILPRDGTVRDSQNPGRDGPGQPNSGTGHGTKRDRAEKGCSKTEKDVLKQENDVLKQEYDVLKQEMWSFLKNSLINFVPGRPGTEGFVPGHLLLPLSRDKGTPRQEFFFCPGTKGQQDVPSHGNSSWK